MRNKVICLCFISLLFLGNAFCDTLTLKSGKKIEGSIKERTKDAVKVDIEGITITYYLTDIDSINGQKISIEQTVVNVEEAKPENPSAATETYSSDEEVSTLQGSQTPANSSSSESKASVPLKEKGRGSFEMSPTKSSAVPPGIAAGVVGGMILLVLLIGLVSYVYSSICLYFIAKKTNSGPSFLAWIPFAHHLLRFKIAKMNYFWIFVPVGLFLLSFISGFSFGLMGALSGSSKVSVAASPIFMVINIFLSAIYAAFSAFVWYKIALARNKKGWIGALMGITILNNVPFVSFLSIIGCAVIIGYLAFSE